MLIDLLRDQHGSQHLPGRVNQRTPGEAGVHDDVGLDIGVNLTTVASAPTITTPGANDAQSGLDGFAGPSQGQDEVTNT